MTSTFPLVRACIRSLCVFLWALGASGKLAAHTISVSQGRLTLEGNRGRYEIRMPLFEVNHIAKPEIDLFGQLHFYSQGVEARLSRTSCRNDVASDAYLCTAEVEFARDTDEITVACKFYSIVVPNHIHILRVEGRKQTEVAIFSATFPEARIQLGSTQMFHAALAQFRVGISGVLTAGGPMLFLAALILACPRRRELYLCAAGLIPAQALGVFIAVWLGWHGPPRAAEALIALASAYLAADVAFRPGPRGRWLLAGALGAVAGPYLLTLCDGTPAAVLFGGVALAQILVIVSIAYGVGRLRSWRIPFHAEAAAARLLCIVGTAWFLARLWL